MLKNFFILITLSLFFISCSTKDDELYNLSSSQWYKQIIKDLQDRDLEKADEHYTSMSSEHVSDPLLEPIALILAQAHIDEEEHKLANFYLDENAKKFGTSKNLDFIRYMQIRSKFESFAQPNREQGLLIETMNQIDEFSNSYPNTQYSILVGTMLTKFRLAYFALDESIADLYKRTGREESYEVYKLRLEESVLKDVPMIKARSAWYRRIFE